MEFSPSLTSCGNFHVSVPAEIDGSDTVSKPEVIINKTITLHCPASGVPQPAVAWFKDGHKVTENTTRRFILDDGWRLQIVDAEIADSTRYSCHAKNVAGESEKYYDLNVLGGYGCDDRGKCLCRQVIVE